jgi:MFS family permease
LKSLLGGIADAFEDGNFRLYSVGSIVSWLSFFVQAVAVSWTAWDLTHSTGWLAIVALLDAAPNIVLMPLGGVIADRYDRFRILLAAYAFATLQAAMLAGLAFAGRLTIGPLAALAFLHGAIHAFSIPAQFGFLPRFVERRRLSSAISVAAAYTQLGIFVGPALAGWVILHFGTAVAFASNVVGYGVYFGFVALLRTPAGYRQPVSGKPFVTDFLDGLRVIAGHRGIAALLALMLLGDALAAAVRQMAPAFADKALGAGVEGLSTLLAAAGVGATLSALWLAHGGARRSSPRTIMWSFLSFLISVAALMLTQNLISAAAAMVAFGGSFEICRTGTVALLQISVPDEIRGRVMSTQFLLLRLAGALGVAAIGATAVAWGLRAPTLCCAACALLVWGATFVKRERIAASFSAPSVWSEQPPLP